MKLHHPEQREDEIYMLNTTTQDFLIRCGLGYYLRVMKEPTDEEINIAIAEFDGWERWKSQSGNVRLVKIRDQKQRDYFLSCGDAPTSEPVNAQGCQRPPIYTEDLNAMHEAERVVLTTTRLQFDYLRHLNSESFDPDWTLADGWQAFATAKQRAIALLKVIKPEMFE